MPDSSPLSRAWPLAGCMVAAILGASGLVAQARAETYQTCTGFIDSVPAVITGQGTWCLRGDLSTAQTSGAAIRIDTNNVTIDCNDFKIGGLAAGAATAADGIMAYNRLNITVRNCNVRGFRRGISLNGAGHVVEDNRLDGNLFVGLEASGDTQHVVRRNIVLDTGGATDGLNTTYGIFSSGAVIDNIVDGVDPVHGKHVTGIRAMAASGQVIRGNVIRNLRPRNGGTANGISPIGGAIIQDNLVIAWLPYGPSHFPGDGIRNGTVCTGNVVYGFATPFANCALSAGNRP